MSRTALLGGTVLDGTGRPGERADVLIDNGVIAAVGRLGALADDVHRIDVSGRCVAPGFVDAHSHGDDEPLVDGTDLGKLTQGVTTEVVGNCGLGLAPRPRRDGRDAMDRFFPGIEWIGDTVADLFAETDRRGYLTNYAPLVAHGALRASVAGLSAASLDTAELARLTERVEEAFAAGVVGVSTGLTYPPGSFAGLDELVHVATVAARAGGVYASHLRSEGRDRLEALEEAITIGRRSGARVEISHHKALGRSAWGTIGHSLARAARARRDGVDVGFDMYPYSASATSLVSCLPPALAALPDDRLLEALADVDAVDRLRVTLADQSWDNRLIDAGGPASILISTTPDGRHAGRTLAELAGQWSTDTAGALARLLSEHRLRVGMVCFAMDNTDVDTVLLDAHTCIGSDSGGAAAGRHGRPHPRGYGSFARILGRYVRERGLLSLAEAVRRMTSRPAEVFGLTGVGRLHAGYAADVVVFDPDVVIDRATYLDPRLPAVGVDHVFISGQHVLDGGRFTGRRAGRRLGPGAPAASSNLAVRPVPVGHQGTPHPHHRKDIA